MAVWILQQPLVTRQQLHASVEILGPHGSVARHAALGAIYVATELHLLTDKSQNHQAMWDFLKQRLDTLDSAPPTMPAMMGTMGGLRLGLPADAVNAVAMSFLEGVTSLFMPTSSRSSTITSMSMSTVGTKASDYKKWRIYKSLVDQRLTSSSSLDTS